MHNKRKLQAMNQYYSILELDFHIHLHFKNINNIKLFTFAGCDSIRFSPGCGQLCPDECKNNHCDAFNGSCIHGCSDPKALTIDCIGIF